MTVLGRSIFLCGVLALAAGARLEAHEGSLRRSASRQSTYAYYEAELNVSAAGKYRSDAAAHMAGQLVQHHGIQHEVKKLLEDSFAEKCHHKGKGKARRSVWWRSERANLVLADAFLETDEGTEGARHCKHLLKKAKEIVKHQEQLANTFDVYTYFVNRTVAKVQNWKVAPAHRDETDKVAAIVLTQGLKDSYIPHNVEYVVRSVAKRLGPGWHLQIFHGPGDQKAELAEALGNPENVTWTPATVDGKEWGQWIDDTYAAELTTASLEPDFTASSKEHLGRIAYNRLRWSPDFYGKIDERHEHILIFELDSLLVQSDCADAPAFLQYDMVGAPARPGSPFPTHFQNGGFTLRRRSTLLKAINGLSRQDAVKRAGGNPDEDTVALYNLQDIHAKIAPDSLARGFSMEQMPVKPACGFHKPWIYQEIKPSFFMDFLESATW
jgi:hypothetical protein